MTRLLGLRSVVPTPAGTVVVEPGTVDDAGALGALQVAVLTEERWFITESDEFDSAPERLRVLLVQLTTSPNSLFLAARHQGALVGALLIQGGALRRVHHVGRLEVFVRVDLRAMGIGNALMEAGLRWATRSEILEKISLAVFADNERALNLYRHHGFTEEGRRLREYLMGDGTYRDDVLMARRV